MEKIEGENEEAREEKNKERPTTETPSPPGGGGTWVKFCSHYSLFCGQL